MTEKKIDRRISRTRRMFREAILELVMEKTFDELTVTEITKRAGLRRATFYLHYDTKEDLLISALSDASEMLSATAKTYTVNDVEIYRNMYRHAADNAMLYQQLLHEGSSATILQDHIRKHFLGCVRAPVEPLPGDVVTQFVSGAVVSLVVWWLGTKSPHRPEVMAQMTHHMVIKGIKSTANHNLLDHP